MQKKLTRLQAYNVMLKYLENEYHQNESDYLGNILSNSEFLSDKTPGDRASWSDWKQAINITALKDKSLKNKNRLTLLQTCKAMFNYINFYANFYPEKPKDFINLLQLLESLQNKYNTQDPVWQEWLSIVNDIITRDDPRVYLKFVK